MTELKKTVYISDDGKVFNTREECLDYELKGCGELGHIKARLVDRIETLRRDIQFAKSKCNNSRCLGYAFRTMCDAKSEYIHSLRMKKIKLEDARNLKSALSTYILAVEAYNRTIALFTEQKKMLCQYVKLFEILTKCDTVDEYYKKRAKIEESSICR